MSKAKDKIKTEDLKTEETSVEESKQPKESQLYYFYTEGCAWCKRANPIVDELINEGHKILKLDLMEIIENFKMKLKKHTINNVEHRGLLMGQQVMKYVDLEKKIKY